jgi:hypothetical protein
VGLLSEPFDSNCQFVVTMFEDFSAASKTESMYTLDSLADKIRRTSRAQKGKLPWLKLARFGNMRTEKNSLRNDANVLTITGIEADYDGEKIAVADAVERLEKAGILAMLYTSPSHTDDTPRWRVLCPTSTDLEPPRREKLMGRLNGLFAGVFSTESWTLSQAYYYGSVNENPSHEVHLIDGTPIDEHDDLDEIWQGKPATVTRTEANGERVVSLVDEGLLLTDITTGASYHASSVRLLGRWARMGVPYMDARRRLVAAFESVPEVDREGRWSVRFADIDRCIEDIYGAEAVQKDAGRRQAPVLEEPPAWIDEAPPWESVDSEADRATEPPPQDDYEVDPFPATPVSFAKLESIPPRELVYGHFLFRKFVSALGAPGGSGKTAYAYAVALALVAGQDFLSEGVYDPGNVWIYNLEDPETELYRRLKAAMIGHGVTFQDIEGRLFMDSGRDRPLVIAKAQRDGTVIAWPQVPALIAEIKARKVHVLIVDPFVRSHRVEENHNDQIDFVAALWASIADAADCAVWLVHHFKKGGVSGDAGAFRGASALIDASRAAVTLSTMAGDEASRLGIPEKERWQYVRVDNAKLNLAPPPDDALWLKLSGVSLDNATDTRQADNVQTVKRWEPPSPWAEFPMSMVTRILDRLTRGPGSGEQYYLTGGTSERWAGRVIMDEAAKTEAQAKVILAAWKKADLIESAEYSGPKDGSKMKQGMKVNQAMVSEMIRDTEGRYQP